ncbi:DNA-binding response regulator [Rathayibacter rathayi]|uniref:DNA-binding response regulator n=2 Tax=Rathayibacter rathayi TaxID=33887 RepID=A0ABD6W9W2_RATRA|nr:response regulator transcription factor [Rathayibacter rathayi]AZZ49364.1 DNA-binding response regulator [Rathayibacter rathayi]MWV73461.1 response regulator [Rathayibacter rathayi NCPPB 2980 = VKM Ac-1601]PPF14987.1 DNA-binding response regulator [Rathayibacter rathayi]PPF24610.1 DNA-binding response regulator [Rathayibacter rathayi]PPF50280.1 DNA-binding response regulator [Rathayibacter rathayi]
MGRMKPAAHHDAAEGPLVRVAIVDDHESVRLGVAAAVHSAGMQVVAAAETVQALESTIGSAEIEVLVLDLSLNDGSSITSNVKWGQVRGSAVLVHSIADRVVAVREALAAGAAGVIPKSSPMSTVVAAIRTVARGEVLNNLEWASAIDADDDFARAVLGRRERDVLHLYASGLPLKLVADRLQISVSTAKEYLDRIREKYVEIGRPAPTKVDLLRRAVEDGILPGIDPDDGDGGR